ncbi:methylmalonyl Co-A mutase-associated GTPase MeaB [Dichotomicrobium thermohalophilum]|uniref:LAO/AO transport system kinase n=1 Tax=Dichotomicrobium thermohalophilum TaxID=933063 RepID=A0A397Q1K1_9HYPH|nr:methylmalonyl Co-A mutase-associated GTPase MeaB [Dichotomicrobium thermohalophilum]RIA55052.1 LAO/AO transport system kinase [Dichotomicrobium thermohalophilum]
MTAAPSTTLVADVLAGKPSAIARLISRAESGADEAAEALAEIHRHTGKAHIVGITGVPGSGKSTLIAQLCRKIREGGRTVAVSAVDPTSPFSGGSILGDRVRMSDLNADPGVFIRSMATRGALGGLSRATMPSVEIFDAAGFDVVIIETVGVGQDEVDVVRSAHTTVVVSAPGLGDDIQAIKAGVLEIADIHVVSKADKPDANRTISELKGMLTIGLQLSGKMDWTVPVIGTSAVSGEGIDELEETIDRHMARMRETGELEARRRRMAEWRVLKSAEDILRDEFTRDREGRIAAIAEQVARLNLAPEEGARQLLAEINRETER